MNLFPQLRDWFLGGRANVSTVLASCESANGELGPACAISKLSAHTLRRLTATHNLRGAPAQGHERKNPPGLETEACPPTLFRPQSSFLFLYCKTYRNTIHLRGQRATLQNNIASRYIEPPGAFRSWVGLSEAWERALGRCRLFIFPAGTARGSPRSSLMFIHAKSVPKGEF